MGLELLFFALGVTSVVTIMLVAMRALRGPNATWIPRDWYLAALLLAALIVNENVVQWMVAVRVGGYSMAAGYQDAFKFITMGGYLFFTAFRLIPYVALGLVLVHLSRKGWNASMLPVFCGGLIGILTMILVGSWTTLRPYYTDEHVSSTSGLAFLFIPIYAVPTGAVGAAVFAGIFSLVRIMFGRKMTEPTDPPESE